MLKDFAYISKSDRIIFILLMLVVLAVTGVALLLGGGDNTETAMANDSTASNDTAFRHQEAIAEQLTAHGERFVFDPNTADSIQLRRLGLSRWQIRNIYKYRAAGGVYSKPTDFARLWGLTKKQYQELAPYIRISDDYKPAAYFYGNEPSRREKSSFGSEAEAKVAAASYPHKEKLKPGERIALNSADTAELKKVPGIGSYFAKQIVQYRKRLGGFSNSGQLMEIRNFPEDALPYLAVSSGEVHKININKASLEELRDHPYISFYQARDIVQFRRMRGAIHSLQQLAALKTFPASAIKKLEPYISY
ncbi:MAG: helix-hairpin-helix domain-containing protein [Prevotella sp.]|jgi:DNA uptake protein ComE-like DNA-binding protein